MNTPLDQLVGQLHAACNLSGRLSARATTANQRDRLAAISDSLASLANEGMRLVMEQNEPQVFEQR